MQINLCQLKPHQLKLHQLGRPRLNRPKQTFSVSLLGIERASSILVNSPSSMKIFFQRYFDLDRLRQILVFVAVIGGIAVNTISNNLFPLNGVPLGELSNIFFTSVQIIPADYAFAIWGIIYMGLIAFAIYQFQPSQRQNPSLQSSGYLFILASLSQCAWIYLFLARLFPLSTIAMLGILLPLIGVYQNLGIGQQQVSPSERWFIQIPISIYLSWITVATVVNISLSLYSLNWDGWGITPPAWAALMMLVSSVIAIFVTSQRHDIAFSLVVVWALIAIVIRQIDTPLIVVTGVTMAIALILISAISTFRSKLPLTKEITKEI